MQKSVVQWSIISKFTCIIRNHTSYTEVPIRVTVTFPFSCLNISIFSTLQSSQLYSDLNLYFATCITMISYFTTRWSVWEMFQVALQAWPGVLTRNYYYWLQVRCNLCTFMPLGKNCCTIGQDSDPTIAAFRIKTIRYILSLIFKTLSSYLNLYFKSFIICVCLISCL